MIIMDNVYWELTMVKDCAEYYRHDFHWILTITFPCDIDTVTIHILQMRTLAWRSSQMCSRSHNGKWQSLGSNLGLSDIKPILPPQQTKPFWQDERWAERGCGSDLGSGGRAGPHSALAFGSVLKDRVELHTAQNSLICAEGTSESIQPVETGSRTTVLDSKGRRAFHS